MTGLLYDNSVCQGLFALVIYGVFRNPCGCCKDTGNSYFFGGDADLTLSAMQKFPRPNFPTGMPMVQNRKKTRKNSLLINHFPTSLGVSERAKEGAQRSAHVKQAGRSKRRSEPTSTTSGFLPILDHRFREQKINFGNVALHCHHN